jgi:hypothetical protein
MRQVRLAATAALIVIAACSAPVPSTVPPTPTASPAPANSPADAAQVVVDAALATMAEGTFRYEVDVRSADPDDPRQPVTGEGQVSFGEPVQFRFLANSRSVIGSSADVIFNGERGFVPAGDALPPGAWLVIDLGPDIAQVVRDAFLRRYGNSALVLVAPLGATEARAAGEEVVHGAPARRFVANVDIALAQPHVPTTVLPAYESRVAAFQAAGTPMTHELDVWVDADGRVVRTRYLQDVESLAAPIMVTYVLRDFGSPMDVAPPDGAQVLTVAQARERYAEDHASPSPSP